jgi:hypothetical protein
VLPFSMITNRSRVLPFSMSVYSGNTLALVHQAKEKVLGADRAMAHLPRFIRGEDQYPTSLVAETLEHIAIVRMKVTVSSPGWR